MANLAQDREWLVSQYRDKTTVEIAAIIGMSASYVKLQMGRLNIPMRKPGRRAGSTNPHTSEWNRRIALSHMKYEQLKDEGWLRGKYEDEGLSYRAIAGLIGCKTWDSVRKAIKLHRITPRPQGVTRGWYDGEKNPNWRGGVSYEPYPKEFNKYLKREIRERDGYVCQLCGADGKDVHHIDYDKKHCDGMNLITLCRSCNVRVNTHRESWEAYLMGVQLANRLA